MGEFVWRRLGAALAPILCATVMVGASGPAQARTAEGLTATMSTTGAAAAVQPPLKLAVTFDSTKVSLWTHSNQSTMPVTTSVVATGAGVVVRRHLTTSTIPDDVAAVPGVVAGNTAHGAFPAYSTDPTAQDFAGLAVTPVAPGPSDILAPGLQDFTFGADFRLNRPLPADSRKFDEGNNVVQRGLTGDDQYKIQVDPTPGGERLSCVLQEGATQTAFMVISKTTIAGGVWYRARCTRTVVYGTDQVVMTLTNLSTGTVLETRTVNSGAPATNLDFPLACAALPTPLSVGVKLYPTGELVKTMSDQVNGRIDNVYLAIG